MGRKRKFSESTKIVNFKVPISKIPEFKKAVNLILDDYISSPAKVELTGNKTKIKDIKAKIEN